MSARDRVYALWTRPADHDAQRWRAFTDAELRELWDGLTLDDGLRYGIDHDDQPAYALGLQIVTEARRRGLQLPDEWAATHWQESHGA